MSSTALPSTLPAAECFARIIDGLCGAIAARGVGGRLTAALLMLLWGRLRRTALRVHRLAARIAAGELVTRQRPASPRAARPSPPRLPRGHVWLVRLVPGTAVYASQLQHWMSDPDMAALAHAPPLRRLLRPLCHMLGVPPPPIQRPPVISEQPRPETPPAPPLRHPAPASFVTADPGEVPPAAAPASSAA